MAARLVPLTWRRGGATRPSALTHRARPHRPRPALTARPRVAPLGAPAAGVADASIAGRLGLDLAAAVLLSENRWFDQDEALIEIGESAAPAGRWVFYPYTIQEGGT